MNKTDLIVRQLGLQDYQEIWHKMQKRLMKFGLSSIILFSHKAKQANQSTYYKVAIYLLFNQIAAVKLLIMAQVSR